MSKSLANPLATAIAAARRLPAETGATAAYKRRLDGAGSAHVVLADVSGSMGDRAGSRRKIVVLQEALDQAMPAGARLIAFSTLPTEIPAGARLPSPEGGTALHLALAAAAAHRPRHTLVLSDGQPDDKAAALAAADRMTGVIDVIYCGPDNDPEAIAFMRELACRGGGRVVVRDLARAAPTALAQDIRLALPAPGARP